MPGPTFIAAETPDNSSITPNPTVDTATQNSTQEPTQNTTHAKSEVEEAADRLYEERIEEEYAKREGGAWTSGNCNGKTMGYARVGYAILTAR